MLKALILCLTASLLDAPWLLRTKESDQGTLTLLELQNQRQGGTTEAILKRKNLFKTHTHTRAKLEARKICTSHFISLGLNLLLYKLTR